MQESRANFLFEKQLSVVLENLPGTLAEICDCLAQAEVNILALSIADMLDTGELRMVVSDAKKAKLLLEDKGYDVLESEVLVVEMLNKPGVLADIAKRLARGKVNIEYCYCSTSGYQGKAMGILKVSDTLKASYILTP